MENKFRLDAKYFFLTYPRCTATRERTLEVVLERLKNCQVTNYVVAIEQHEDGTPHLHCLIALATRKHIASANYFDFDGFHPNIQKARDRKKVYAYVTKADGECLNTFDEASLNIKEKKNTRAEVGKRVLGGENLEELVEEYPNLIFGYKRLKEDIVAYKEAKVQYCTPPNFLPNQWGFLIQPFSKSKQRHYWIFSQAPNRGKTTWARDLEAKYGAYIKSADFTYWNVTGREPFIILDDYNTAGLRFNALNQLCDGNYEARVFMAGVRRLQPKLVIVLSNAKIEEIYPIKYELIKARFIEKCID